MILQSANDFETRAMNPVPAIQVTAVYEDLEAGIRAKALIDCIQSGLDLPARFKLDLWRFDWLGELSMRNMALNIAKTSTLVLISASSNNPFPVEVDRWLRAWMPSRDEQLSAIVLLATDTQFGVRHPLQESLQRVAEQKQVPFYCEFFKPSPGEHAPVSAYRGGHDEMFRPRHERSPLLPAIGNGTRVGQPGLSRSATR